MLHNLTPHFHSETGEEWAIQKTQEADSPFDWLNDLFGFDLGEGHLECFSVQKEKVLDAGLDFPDFQDFTFFTVFNEKCTFFSVRTPKSCIPPPLIDALKEHNLSACGLRGPPTV